MPSLFNKWDILNGECVYREGTLDDPTGWRTIYVATWMSELVTTTHRWGMSTPAGQNRITPPINLEEEP